MNLPHDGHVPQTCQNAARYAGAVIGQDARRPVAMGRFRTDMSAADQRQAGRPHWSVVLRGLREAAGVTQAGWAAWLGYGLRTVQRWEHAELAPDSRATEALVRVCSEQRLLRDYHQGVLAGLTVTPEWLITVLAEARLSAPVHLRHQPPLEASSQEAMPGGHVLTSFVGRERDQGEIRRLFETTRLITLMGPGGVGKSRLAIEVARGVASKFADGVRFIELAPLADARLVPHAVAAALGIREQPGQPVVATLADMLRHRQLLIVLDNCEHVPSGCTELVLELLYSCAELHFLTTSRLRLGVAGEYAWPVSPLTVPDASINHEPDLIGQFEAVQLFVQRARTVVPGFGLSVETAPAIAEMCRRLDGLPLAIELAAPWTRVLSPRDLAQRLLDQPTVLVNTGPHAPDRQRSLKTTLDWSYNLLAERDQRVLARLSVLAGGATVTIAETIAASDDDSEPVLVSLARLVDASLVQRVELEGAESRIRLLETVREYAYERLIASGEVDDVRWRHAIAFRDLAETARPYLTGAGQSEWLDRLENDHENLREALEWALQHADAELSGRIAASLSLFWYHRGHIHEGRTSIEGVLALPRQPSQNLRRAMLQGKGLLALHHGDYPAARTAAEEGVSSAREMDDAPGLVEMLGVLGFVARVQEDWIVARDALNACLDLARKIGHLRGQAIALHHLGLLALEAEQDYTSAWSLSEASLRVLADVGDQRLRGNVLIAMARVARARGHLSTARELVKQSWSAHQQVGDPTAFSILLSTLAGIAADEARFDEAVRLASAANRAMALLGSQEWPSLVRERQKWWDAARAALAPEAFDRAWSAGQTQTLQQVVAVGLASIDGSR